MHYTGKTTGQQAWSGDVGHDNYQPADTGGTYVAGVLGHPPPSIARKPSFARRASDASIVYGQDIYSLPNVAAKSIGR
jgi:hypothetical protein